jgi:hypothetical protein
MESTSTRSVKQGRERAGSAEHVRSLLEPRIVFSEAGSWATGSPLATAFKDALCSALAAEDVERIRVRCGVTRDDDDGLRFMCKVEYAGDGSASGLAAYPWSWWSPLVAKPEELVGELRRALRTRRERLGTSEAPPTRLPGADKARGASHDTWTTAPWDLGRSVKNDSFCRNRRGRFNGHAAAEAKPFRPRSPR